MIKKMNILFLNKFNDYWKEKFYSLEKEFSYVNFIATFDPKERPIELTKADAVVTGRLLKEEIENSPALKVIFVPFTGLNYDHADFSNMWWVWEEPEGEGRMGRQEGQVPDLRNDVRDSRRRRS